MKPVKLTCSSVKYRVINQRVSRVDLPLQELDMVIPNYHTNGYPVISHYKNEDIRIDISYNCVIIVDRAYIGKLVDQLISMDELGIFLKFSGLERNDLNKKG
jgi:hypothetical protein